MKTVLVLGGYGNFGQRIVETLASEHHIHLVIAGRNLHSAQALLKTLTANTKANLSAMAIDANSADFTAQLLKLNPFLVIHTCGPYQGQSNKVAKACIAAKAHYIDLADDPDYVASVSAFDDIAKEKDICLISGASSVPGLSAAVIDKYQRHFAHIDSIDIAIAPGNKAERGQATVQGILSYVGHGFRAFRGGTWQQVYGWMEPRSHLFGLGLGKRWLANVDVPDLTLFPDRYKVKDYVRFQAGLELPILHLSMVAMAKLAKVGLVKNWATLTKPIFNLSILFKYFGTDDGGMEVNIKGANEQGKSIHLRWTLFAPNGIGPYIPTLSAIIAANKLLTDSTDKRGAGACVDIFALEDFYPYFKQFGIEYEHQLKYEVIEGKQSAE